MRYLCVALSALMLCHYGVAAAGTVHLYRFEDDPGFMTDTTGNADLTPINVSQVYLSGSGRGSAFPTWGGGNASAMDVGTYGRAYATVTPIVGNFTAEAFVHFDTLAGSFGANIVGPTAGGVAGSISWTLEVRFDGAGGTLPQELILYAVSSTSYGWASDVVSSGIVMVPLKDYYVGASFDLAGGDVVFYVQNLTDAGALQVVATTHSLLDLNPITDLGVGGFAGSNLLSMDGLIDEVRICDTVLAQEDLLINLDAPPVPEPATMGLLGLGLAALAGRRRLKRLPPRRP